LFNEPVVEEKIFKKRFRKTVHERLFRCWQYSILIHDRDCKG